MAELDYAFLADFARVDPNGTLTAVGASWTQVLTPTVPSTHRMAVAGRVRSRLGAAAVPFTLEVQGPGESFRMQINGELRSDNHAFPYGDGKIGIIFALNLDVPLPTAGLYQVYLSLDEVRVRRLAFDVFVGAPPQP